MMYLNRIINNVHEGCVFTGRVSKYAIDHGDEPDIVKYFPAVLSVIPSSKITHNWEREIVDSIDLPVKSIEKEFVNNCSERVLVTITSEECGEYKITAKVTK